MKFFLHHAVPAIAGMLETVRITVFEDGPECAWGRGVLGPVRNKTFRF